MTEFEETSKKIQDLVGEVFKQSIGVGYDHGLEVGTHNGYRRGYANGQKSIEECAEKITYKDIHDAYQRGLDDAWECARKIYNHEVAVESIFNRGFSAIIRDMTASEAIAKVREYKQVKQADDEYVDAVVKVRVPKWQIGQEVNIYFKDSMYMKGIIDKW